MTGSHEVRGSIPLGSTKVLLSISSHEATHAYPQAFNAHQQALVASHNPERAPELVIRSAHPLSL